MKKQRTIPERTALLIVLGLAVALILCRGILQMHLPIWGNGDAWYDDALMTAHADTFLKGQWMGPYSSQALSKGSGFSVFLALGKVLHLPLGMWLSLFYGAACLVLLLVLKKLFRGWILPFLSFLFLLFSPVLLEVRVGPRFYCLSLIPPLAILFFAGFLGAFLSRKEEQVRAMVGWLLLAGFSVGAYTWVRADYTWMLLFTIGVLALMGADLLLTHQPKKRLWLLVLPIAALLLSEGTLCTVNRAAYGIFTTSDFTGAGFSSMCKEMMKLQPAEELKGVYVTRETMLRVGEISPAFQPVAEKIEEDAQYSYYYQYVGEWGAEYYAWELRNAMTAVGQFQDAKETDRFCKEVTEDIRRAVREGKLLTRDAVVLSPFVGPVKASDFPGLLKDSLVSVVKEVIPYRALYASFATYTGPEENLTLMSELGRQELFPDAGAYALKIGGYLFSTEGQSVTAVLTDAAGHEVPLSFRDSPGVADLYNFQYAQAAHADFEVKLHGYEMDTAQPLLRVMLGDETVYEGPAEGLKELNDPRIKADFYEFSCGAPLVPQEQLLKMASAEKYIALAEGLIRFYRITGIVVGVIAFLLFFGELILGIWRIKKDREWIPFWIFKLGVLLALLALVAMVCIHSIPYDETFDPLYGIGAFTVYQVFVVLNLETVVRNAFSLRHREDRV